MMNRDTFNIDRLHNLKHNYIVNLLDGGFFGTAIGFASFTTFLPLFVSTLTNSAILIGLIPAIHAAGWQLPQLLTVKRISRMSRFKPFVMMMTIQERIPFLGLALIALLTSSLGKELSLIAIFILLIWQGLGGGITANAWQIMMSRVIPPDYLATFFGFQGAAANLLASGGAVLAGFILETVSYPWNYFACFMIACFFFAISWFFLNLTRESERIIEQTTFSDLPLWHGVQRILRRDLSFRWYLISRIVTQFASMAFSFYIVFAVRNLGMSEITAGVMTGILMLTQVAAGVSLGWLADRWGRRTILVLGAAATTFSAILACIANDLVIFYFIFFLTGIGNSAFWSAGMAFTMDFGTEEERPTYVGMANTLIAPAAILAPLLGGWVADIGGFRLTFSISAFAALLAMLILVIFVKESKRQN